MNSSSKEYADRLASERETSRDKTHKEPFKIAGEGRPLNVEDVLDSMDETVYRWNVETDEMSWASNAASVLDVPDMSEMTSGRAFVLRVDADQAGERFDAMTGAGPAIPNSTFRYRTSYRFLPEGRRGTKARWLEEVGLCQLGPEGKLAFVQATLRVVDDWSEKEQRLHFLSSHDELTGQLNRTRLTEQLSELLANPRPGGSQAAFLLIAVNDLSLINETYGFDIGDQVIAVVGRRLARVVRGKDRVGRFASNKFGILLDNCPGQGIALIARRIMAIIADHAIETSSGAVTATVSIGAVRLPEDASNAQLASGRALQALEQARRSRSDHFLIYQRSERRESERRRAAELADEIVSALNDRRMLLALQPIVRSKTREVVSYEGLLRARKLDGSVLPAGDFVDVAEQFGLTKLLDVRVLELICEIAKQQPYVRLAINVSPSAVGDKNWMAAFEAMAKVNPSIPERLTIEVTEEAAIGDLEATAQFFAALKRFGCKIALDGFGTGYSSFRHLRTLGIDMVKIDSSFIESHTARAAEGSFVRTLVDLAGNLGLETVGEGVMDETTADFLERVGITYMQGYFFGGPELVEIGGGRPQLRFDRDSRAR
ncbi:bifunctional diguanylate cyclase/phosphodiesterase [Methyloligella sp. 2.7D]|uniref:bifunctional diguanylate cyclase/phosphodiesterase n=1 Tax=unclassified Methyloligella TaxID=2625955 RepID=UPI00157D956C|nr:bifunctional diguanylate cyclase/phosphodiesterase [Methyloligella sp. GL2]QKP76457.1 bifunctional diguanylate cyclase/phosphodiesterase [Methyloligella sp. GL2]